MLRWMLALPLAAALLGPTAAPAQECAHGRDEAPDARTRRLDALQAARLINAAQGTKPRIAAYIPWSDLGSSSYVAGLRADGGSAGELARRMNWGGTEVLPGWRVHFVVTGTQYAFSLRDVRDPCGFTYSSDDSAVVMKGYPIDRDGTLPRRTTQ